MILRPQQIALMRLGLPVIPANDSGGDSAPAQQTITNQTIGDDQRGYFHDIMARTQAVSEQPYTAYQGPRVAGFNDMHQTGFNTVRNLQEQPELGDASNTLTTARNLATTAAMNTKPGQIGSDYDAKSIAMFGAPQDVKGTFNAGEFNGNTAAKYMSPYQDAVTGATVREMDRRHDIDGVGRDATAAQRGSFGGSRAALVQEEANRNHEMNVSDTIAKGRQSAYENAQSQFERDRQAQFGESQQDMDASKFNVGMDMDYGKTGLGLAQFNEGQQQQESLMRMQGQTANEANRAQFANINQQGIGMLGSLAGQTAQLGSQRQDDRLERVGAYFGAGDMQQGLEQRVYDENRTEFENQRDAERNNLAFYASMMRGSTPSTISSQTSTYNQQPSSLQQAAGLGLGAFGMMGAMGKMGG